MIPLRDVNPTRTTPVLTYGLIAVNALVFLYMLSLDPQAQREFSFTHGVIPRALLSGDVGAWSTPFTSMFMHGGWLHLIFNMWTLYIFADNIEDALGKPRFILFYLATGLIAVFAHVVVQPEGQVPLVGASGAISGVLGGYLLLFPSARILTLIPIFFFFFLRELPAALFIAVWFIIQLLSGMQSLAFVSPQSGGIAFFAHIGGFVAGVLLVRALQPPRRRPPRRRGGWGVSAQRRAEGWNRY